MPDEAEIKALLETAEGARKRPSRGLWIASVVASLVCVAALGYGLLTDWDAEPTPVRDAPVEVKRSVDSGGGGFGLGLLLGIAAGVAIGSALAARRRQS